MKVVIVDCGSGNLNSVYRSLDIAGKNLRNFKIKISNSPKEILSADKIVLPGQGSFRQCVQSILKKKDLWETLDFFVVIKRKSIFGICVGMQLFSTVGYEEKKTKGFGWIDGKVEKIEFNKKKFNLPHMGWNNIMILNKKNIFHGIKQNMHFYFIHSYEIKGVNPKYVLAEVNYGKQIVASVCKDHIFGSQFHPEKSQVAGIKILSNFLKI